MSDRCPLGYLLQYVRCKSGVTFVRRCFCDGNGFSLHDANATKQGSDWYHFIAVQTDECLTCSKTPKTHHANMFVLCTPHYTPLLNSKTGVYWGIHYFLIFGLKHREVEGPYYPSSENKGADQLRGHREVDLRLCFRVCKKSVFS